MAIERRPVRLGVHQGRYVFEVNRGLHEPVTGLAVLGTGPDPEVMFEEHGTGVICRYLEVHDGAQLNPDLGPRDVMEPQQRADLAARTQSDDPETRLHAMMSVFGLEDADVVNEMLGALRTVVERTQGTVSIVAVTSRLQRRNAMLRVLHSAQAQPDRELDLLLADQQPLGEHSIGGDVFQKQLYEPLVLLASPYTLGFVAVRAVPEASDAYVLVVLLGDDQGLSVDDAEAKWDNLFETSPIFRKLRLAGPSWVADVNAPIARVPSALLIGWWTEGLNRLLTELTDLGRYRSADGLFDARGAYRERRTLDRVFLNCVRIQLHVRDHVGRVGAAFEFFDLLPSLLGSKARARDVWTAFGEPDAALALLRDAFASAPDPLRAVLRERAERVIANLREEILATVVPGRQAEDGVLVGEPPVWMAADEYVGKLLQSLRDTHHGYRLDSAWKRDVLDSHTGHIPYAFPELVVLYVVGLVADPSRALHGGWLG